MLAAKPFGKLYVGRTGNLRARIQQHRWQSTRFTKRHSLYRLVYYTKVETLKESVLCEQRLKRWKWTWKVELIVKENPGWLDLWGELPLERKKLSQQMEGTPQDQVDG